MRVLKQSTARNIMIMMIDSADHITGLAGLTLTISASKNGGSFSTITPTVTDRGLGWYSLAMTTSHTDTLGDFALHVTGGAADPADTLMQIVAYDPNDASLGLSIPSAATIASAVFNETLSGHTTSGTFGEWVNMKAMTLAKYLGL